LVPGRGRTTETLAGASGTLPTIDVPEVDEPGTPSSVARSPDAPTTPNAPVALPDALPILQATLNSGLADIIMGVDYRVGSGPQLGGLAFRLTDTNKHLVLLADGSALQLYRKQNGTYTLLASQPIPAVAVGSTHRLEVRTHG